MKLHGVGVNDTKISLSYVDMGDTIIHHHHSAAVVSRGWANASACRLQVTLVLSSAISCRSSICPGRLLTAWPVPHVVCYCHNYGLQVLTREVHRSPLKRLKCPARDHFIVHTLLIMYYVCPLPDQDVGMSIIVCDVEHTYFHFGRCGRTFVLCLFGQCTGLCTILYHSRQHTAVVHMSFQVDDKVDFKGTPACHDFSMYLFECLLVIHESTESGNYYGIFVALLFSKLVFWNVCDLS